MSALPDTVVPFQLPAKKPRITEQEPTPDQRKVAVLPIRAAKDKRLHGATLRCLITLCSYCNRAGLTWVGQARLGQDLGITRQAVSKQLALLQKLGYMRVVKKGFRGSTMNTMQVIFDPTVSPEDAVAITSSQEDTRPPYMRKEQEDQTPDPDGQRRIAQLIAQALRQPTKPPEKTMPKPGQSITVKKMKEEIEATKKKRQKTTHTQPSEVAHAESLHTQLLDTNLSTSEGCTEHKNRLSNKDSVVKEVIGNLQVDKLLQAGMTAQQIREAADFLLPIYQAEGLTPTPDLLADSILQLHRDAA